MKKILMPIAASALSLSIHAQIRTANSASNISVNNSPAFIDASSNTTVNGSANIGKGLVFPRINLSAMTAFPAVTAGIPNSFPTRFDGMMVYNTATSGTAGVGATSGTLSPGFWYYDNKSAANNGGTWKPVSSAAVTAAASNGLTVASSDVKLGGTLIQPTTITNNGNALNITGSATGTTFSPNGFVGIGTAAPSESLQVSGAAKIGRPGVNSIYVDGINTSLPFSGNGLITSSIKDGGILYSEEIMNLGIRNLGQLNILSGGTDFSSDKALDKTVASFQAGGKAGINTDAPAVTLDINAFQPTGTSDTPEGILIPRVDRQRAQNMTAVPISTLVYINSLTTGTQAGTAAQIDSVGFYYFNGSLWAKLLAPAAGDNLGNHSATQNLSLNNFELRLRGDSDAAQSLAYNSTLNGPRLSGAGGGSLGTSNGINGLSWNNAGKIILPNSNSALQFSNSLQNRKIVLWEDAANDHQYSGLGINSNSMRYQVPNTNTSHVFYAANSASGSNELLRITGSGNVGIGTANPQGILHIDGTKDNPASGAPSISQQANDFTVTASGNVGMGINTPGERLDIASGNLRVRNITSTPGAASTDRLVVADTNGVLKTLNGIQDNYSVFHARLAADQSVNGNITTLLFSNPLVTTPLYTYNTATGILTFSEPGNYQITIQASFLMSEAGKQMLLGIRPVPDGPYLGRGSHWNAVAGYTDSGNNKIGELMNFNTMIVVPNAGFQIRFTASVGMTNANQTVITEETGATGTGSVTNITIKKI